MINTDNGNYNIFHNYNQKMILKRLNIFMIHLNKFSLFNQRKLNHYFRILNKLKNFCPYLKINNGL